MSVNITATEATVEPITHGGGRGRFSPRDEGRRLARWRSVVPAGRRTRMVPVLRLLHATLSGSPRWGVRNGRSCRCCSAIWSVHGRVGGRGPRGGTGPDRPVCRADAGALEAFGGTVEKFIGDAVMAVLRSDGPRGRPGARGSSGTRPVGGIDAEPADGSLDLSVRIGVNTGEAVVTLGARPELGEGMVAGDVVNTAAGSSRRRR